MEQRKREQGISGTEEQSISGTKEKGTGHLFSGTENLVVVLGQSETNVCK